MRLLFGQLLGKICLLLDPSSGHTVADHLFVKWCLPFKLIPSRIRLNDYPQKWAGIVCKAFSVTRKKSPKFQLKLAKNDFTTKIKTFVKFTNIAYEWRRFWQNSCRQRLWKVAQSPINRPIWSHWRLYTQKAMRQQFKFSSSRAQCCKQISSKQLRSF